jgi:hypothetical protein
MANVTSRDHESRASGEERRGEKRRKGLGEDDTRTDISIITTPLLEVVHEVQDICRRRRHCQSIQ